MNPVPLNEQDYEKQKGPITSSESFVLPDQYWWCNKKRFLIILKITSAKLFKPTHDIINYPTVICPFSSGKHKEERKKLQKNWISSEQKGLFR